MLVDGVSSLSMTAQLTGGKRDAVPMPELGMGRGKRARRHATKDGREVERRIAVGSCLGVREVPVLSPYGVCR